MGTENINELEFDSPRMGAKYNDVFEAALGLTPGQAHVVQSPEGLAPERHSERIRIAMQKHGIKKAAEHNLVVRVTRDGRVAVCCYARD